MKKNKTYLKNKESIQSWGEGNALVNETVMDGLYGMTNEQKFK